MVRPEGEATGRLKCSASPAGGLPDARYRIPRGSVEPRRAGATTVSSATGCQPGARRAAAPAPARTAAARHAGRHLGVADAAAVAPADPAGASPALRRRDDPGAGPAGPSLASVQPRIV